MPNGSPFSKRLSLLAPTEHNMNGGKKVTALQGKEAPAGGVPALNIERIYRTTVPADELAEALAGHFRAQKFEAQVFRASGDRTVMQARKESLWRHLLGVAYALTVVFTPGEGQLSIGLGSHEWVDTPISGPAPPQKQAHERPPLAGTKTKEG